MQLSLHSEYALRVLLYLGTTPDEVVPTERISRAFDISKHHLVRVMQTLAEAGYIKVITGRSGGVSLAMDPATIRLGQVVRDSEPGFRIAECFDERHNNCVATPVCPLKPVLKDALESFLGSLDNNTLADLLARAPRRRLTELFSIRDVALS